MAGDGGVEYVGEGVVDDADTWAPRNGEAEGDAGVGEGVDEVGRAVDLRDGDVAYLSGHAVLYPCVL